MTQYMDYKTLFQTLYFRKPCALRLVWLVELIMMWSITSISNSAAACITFFVREISS